MQVREEDMMGLQPLDLLRLRLLDLHDHVRLCEHSFSRGKDACAGANVSVVTGVYSAPRTRLHDHLVSARGELAHRARHQTDAILIAFDFLWHTYSHQSAPRSK